MLTQPQREELRAAVREVLVAASTVAFSAEVIARRVARLQILDFTPEITDVTAALAFLVSCVPPQATSIHDPLGANPHYQATATGVLAHERSTP